MHAEHSIFCCLSHCQAQVIGVLARRSKCLYSHSTVLQALLLWRGSQSRYACLLVGSHEVSVLILGGSSQHVACLQAACLGTVLPMSRHLLMRTYS